MERRIHLYVSRKNVLTWLMALCLVGSAVARIAIPCMKGEWDSLEVWSQIVLPVTATLLFVIITLLGGKEMFYKTAIPVWMMGIYFAILPHPILGGHPFVLGMYIICILFYCVLYTGITAGRLRFPWLLLLLALIPLAGIGYTHHFYLEYYEGLIFIPEAPSPAALALYEVLANYLLFAGLFFLVFAVQVHADGKYHPTWGDRPDGRRVRSLDPMSQITAFFQVERNTCSNLYEDSIEISNIERYIRQKRREGYTDFGITHVLLAAYVRGIAKYPQLNRFISGQKVYSRGEDIIYCMTVKKTMAIDSPDTCIKVHLSPRDTAFDIYNKFSAVLKDAKKTEELDSSFDGFVSYLTLIPSVVLKFTVWLLKLLDYFGLLPGFLTELSPFHGSLFMTSMGSLGIRPVYHHLYDFGNIPCFGAFGMKRKALEVTEDGAVVQKKYVDIKFTLDERICDGYYYATFFKYFKRLLAHPEVLDQLPEKVEKDID